MAFFPDPVELLTTCRNKVRKTLPITPKSINFNKTQMAKHPDIELNTAEVYKSIYDMRMGLKNRFILCNGLDAPNED